MHWLDGCSMIRAVGRYITATLQSGRIAANLVCFDEVSDSSL